MTVGQVNEVQLIRCDLNPASYGSTPMFTLYFQGAVTAPFSAQASAATVSNALNALSTVGSVSVAYSMGVTFCDSSYLAWAGGGVPAGELLAV